MILRTCLLLLASLSSVVVNSLLWEDFEIQHSTPNIDISALMVCYTAGGDISETKQGFPEYGSLCTVKVPLWSADDKHANELCKSHFPFHIKSAQKQDNGGFATTGCVFHINLICQTGWNQMNGRCYQVVNQQLTYEEAQTLCKNHQSDPAMKNTQVAEYYSPNLKIDFEHFEFDEAWVDVPDLTEYFENVSKKQTGALFVHDGHWKYEVKAGTLLLADLTERHPTICEYTPLMTMAESFLKAEQFAPMYPMIIHANGITFYSNTFKTLSQEGLVRQQQQRDIEKFSNKEMEDVCSAIGKIFSMESFPQTSNEEEFNMIKDRLTEHSIFLTGAYKEDGCENTGYKDHGNNQQGLSPVYKDPDGKNNYCNAHSFGFSRTSRVAGMAALRAPCLCALHTFTYAYQDCEDYPNFKTVQYLRESNSRICHYIRDHQNNYVAGNHSEAVKECNKIGAVLSGFEENDEVEAVKAKMDWLDSWESHYWMGGHVPCRGNCLLKDPSQRAMASWDPAVSSKNNFLNTYNHELYPWTDQGGNEFIAFRADNQAFHTHNGGDGKMYVICAKYASQKATRRDARVT